MSNEINAILLSIMRSIHLARDAVLFTLFGVAVNTSNHELVLAYRPLLWLILDFVVFFLLWVPRGVWKKVGLGSDGLMSIFLLMFIVPYGSANYFGVGPLMILLLCISELLTVLKITYDITKAEAKSWTEDTES